ncbi:pyrimidine dimer DNA glycosylase/endonuclease V [Actinotalea sp. AC32]|nr:pyrimidine dimer DNA glycosylase/endonuclease V [Actinotalea sp. AC32]
MRLWSVHPRYLDRQGLTACWREGLLAQKVLTGTTRGYRNHPQLERFRVDGGALLAVPADGPGIAPGAPVTTYLHGVVDEAETRGYAYDRARVLAPPDPDLRLEVTHGQLLHEWAHLRLKLAARSPDVLRRWAEVDVPDPHPLFVVVPGPVARWEVLTDG